MTPPSLEEIRQSLRRYPHDAPIRLRYEFMLDLIERAAYLMRNGMLPIDANAGAARLQWLLDAQQPDWTEGDPDPEEKMR